jgi:hypothetical protein
MQIDLAMSPLDDDAFDAALSEFGAPDRETFGIGQMVNYVLSSDPASVPVADIRKMKIRLKRTGYTPPDAVVDDEWSPTWQSAFRRAEADGFERVRSGKHFLAATTQEGAEFLSWLAPENVWKGLVLSPNSPAAASIRLSDLNRLSWKPGPKAVAYRVFRAILPV